MVIYNLLSWAQVPLDKMIPEGKKEVGMSAKWSKSSRWQPNHVLNIASYIAAYISTF